MALDWIQNLFQSEQTRGLSGDSAASVALDESNPYYNYRLRRQKAEGDLVANPALLWHTSTSVKRRGGLGVHIASEKGEGVATFTDVLLILSHEDYSRAVSQTAEPWLQRAMRTLLSDFDDFCRKEAFSRRHAHRQLGFRILCDGSADMGGQVLGLQAGEFITGLLPNLYTGPVRGSFPVIGVHLNLPGVWDGYKEIGRLYNDQILFTLGSHWLDNFHHPVLREAALYRLQQYPDGSFVHIINPDLQDRYQVTSTDQGGASVLTLATRDGAPLAYMVLAVIDPPSEQAGGDRLKPGINLPDPAGTPMATIPPPMLIDDQLVPSPNEGRRSQGGQAGQAPPQTPAAALGVGSKTIIPDAPSQRIFTLQERGALLQKVHFASFMDGYDVYLGTRGELGTVVEDKAATFQVRRKRVSLLAHVDGVQVAGFPVAPGVEIPIEGDVIINVGGQRLEYRDLRHITSDGWPYVGEIRRPASSNYMVWGEAYQIGRSRDCRVVLPDEPRNDNIQWKPGISDGAKIRARSGEIEKSRFYTDSIMVASTHSQIDLRLDEPVVACQARQCYVYIRRGSEIISLYPTESGKQPVDAALQPSDEVLIGNCLFQVGYTPREEGVAPAPAPKIELSADHLVAALGPSILEDVAAARSTPDPSEAGRIKAPPLPPPRPGASSAAATQPNMKAAAGPTPPPLASTVKTADLPPKPPPAAPPPPPPKPSDAPPPPPAAAAPPPAVDAPLADVPPPVRQRKSIDRPAPDEPAAAHGIGQSGNAPKPVPVPPMGADSILGLAPEFDENEQMPPPTNPKKGATPLPPPSREEEEETSPGRPSLRIDSWDADGEGSLDEPTDAGSISKVPTADLDDDGPPPPPPSPPKAEEPKPEPPKPPEPPPPPPRPEPPPAAVEPPPPPPPKAPEPPTPEPVMAQAAPPVEAPAPPPVERTKTEPKMAPVAGFGTVLSVDDAEVQVELGRRMQLIHSGWTINGTATCGNHDRADLVIPENRMAEDQQFEARDYFHLKVRGRRGSLDVKAPRELLINGDDPDRETYEELEKVTIDVIRRDDRGDEDFAVRLLLLEDKSLPDPRARYLEIDYGDPLAAALFTRGLPTRQPRTFEVGSMKFALHFDGENVVLDDYLDTYAKGGFKTLFVQKAGERFQTAPEDGAPVTLAAGDRLVVGHAVYVLRKG